MKIFGYVVVAVLSATIGAIGALFLSKNLALGGGSISYEKIERLGPRQVAELVLPGFTRSLTESVVAVGFEESVAPREDPEERVVDFVDLRLKARGAGRRGVCVADNLGIHLQAGHDASGLLGTASSGAFRVLQTYRIVGDTTPDKEWSEAYEAELDTACEALGPHDSFFPMGVDVDLRALTDMLPALRNDATTASIECAGNEPVCRSPRGALRALHPEQITWVSSIQECDEDQTCLVIIFHAGGDSPNKGVWTVNAKGSYRGTYSTGFGKLVLSEVSLDFYSD
jgi:hypothetical protein